MELLFDTSRLAAQVPIAPVSARTLVLLRWFALLGQLAALILVGYSLDYPLPTLGVAALLAASVGVNLITMLRHPGGSAMTEREATLQLGFDVLQLCGLLYLTGGLVNPFSILILAPVMVAATILTRRATVLLTALSVLLSVILAFFHFPLPWYAGGFDPPDLYEMGLWVSTVLALVFMTSFTWLVAEQGRREAAALAATQAALAREQRLSALGSLAAAAAHELGTPLATITLVAREMQREVLPDDPLHDDVALLVSQAERCRTILAELSRRPEEGPTPFDRMPISALVEQAAEPYRREGVPILFERDGEGREPQANRSPELLHGLGNLLQNGLHFASGAVEVAIQWGPSGLTLTITDDGPGYPDDILHRLGEPYLSGRSEVGGHMGLGLFIARTLLERTGASVAFTNAEEGGARVTVAWPRGAPALNDPAAAPLKARADATEET